LEFIIDKAHRHVPINMSKTKVIKKYNYCFSWYNFGNRHTPVTIRRGFTLNVFGDATLFKVPVIITWLNVMSKGADIYGCTHKLSVIKCYTE
jgi:hypothetical protein